MEISSLIRENILILILLLRSLNRLIEKLIISLSSVEVLIYITVPNQNYPQGVFNPVYACFTVVEDTRCILRMHNERIYSCTSCIT